MCLGRAFDQNTINIILNAVCPNSSSWQVAIIDKNGNNEIYGNDPCDSNLTYSISFNVGVS